MNLHVYMVALKKSCVYSFCKVCDFMLSFFMNNKNMQQFRESNHLEIYITLWASFERYKKVYSHISTKYLQVILACNTEIIHDFFLFHAQKIASSRLEFEPVAFIINTDYVGAHYHNLWAFQFCEDFSQC